MIQRTPKSTRTATLCPVTTLVRSRPEVGPVVILREFQYLRDIGGEVLLSEVFRKLESKKQGRSLVSIFIESSTYTWVDPTHFLRSRSEEHTSELQSLMRISYAVFCLKTKNQPTPPP